MHGVLYQLSDFVLPVVFLAPKSNSAGFVKAQSPQGLKYPDEWAQLLCAKDVTGYGKF